MQSREIREAIKRNRERQAFQDDILFLSGLSDEQKQTVIQQSVFGLKRRGETLFEENDLVEGVYFIRRGKVKLSTTDNEGRERIIGIFIDSDMIWEGVFMGESRYPYDAVCVTEVEYCWIGKETLEEIIRDPANAMMTINILSKKLHDANERNKVLSTTDPVAKLAGFLLYRNRYTSQDLITLHLDDIAASVHLRPETVSRKIKELEAQGYVERVGKSGLKLVNIPGLQDVFDGVTEENTEA
jgi:CRP/FNR family transcriptional regulator, anaerobic regulatory protein